MARHEDDPSKGKQVVSITDTNNGQRYTGKGGQEMVDSTQRLIELGGDIDVIKAQAKKMGLSVEITDKNPNQ